MYVYVFVHSIMRMCIVTAGSVRRTNAYYGAGTGPIYMDNVGCNGRESSLFDCSLDANAAEDNHNEDAGVFCWPKGVFVCLSVCVCVSIGTFYTIPVNSAAFNVMSVSLHVNVIFGRF